MSDRSMPTAVAQAEVVGIPPTSRSFAEAAARVFADEARRAVERAGRFRVALVRRLDSAARPTALLATPPLSDEVPWDLPGRLLGRRALRRCRRPPQQRAPGAGELCSITSGCRPSRCTPCGVAAETRARAGGRPLRGVAERAPDGAEAPAARPGTWPRGPRPSCSCPRAWERTGTRRRSFLDRPRCESSVHWVTGSFGGGTAPSDPHGAFINLAGLVVFVVAGEAKAEAVRRVLEGSRRRRRRPARPTHSACPRQAPVVARQTRGRPLDGRPSRRGLAPAARRPHEAQEGHYDRRATVRRDRRLRSHRRPGSQGDLSGAAGAGA